MLQRFLLIWLVLLCGVAFVWPDWISAEFDPFRESKPWLPHLFAVTMFALGGLLPRDEIRQVFEKWPTVLGGTALQYSIMPLAAYGLGHAAGFEGDLLLGVILVGCVPGAMASNVLTLTARGNVSYSVSLTTAATLASPVVVPLVLYLAIRQTGVDRAALVVSAFSILMSQVVGPVAAGHLLSRVSTTFQNALKSCGPVIANLAILWIIAVVVNANRGNLASAGVPLFAALLGVNLLGLLGGYGGGRLMRLPVGMRRALTLEIGMQNAGLGTVLAGQLFADQSAVALPPALYTFGCMLTGTVLAQMWAVRQADSD
jgi:bile acid:Na+ symporter, BASS family